MYSIIRHIEPIVERRARNSKAILLTGPRQVGKSTLFKHLFSSANQVTFDDDLMLAQASEDVGLFLMNNPCPLMIDEVQKCPSIFNRLKIVLDNTDKLSNFYLTGSQKLQLMENVSDSLAGRISIVELEGLSLREINGVNFNRHFVPTEEYLAEREKHLKKYGTDIWATIHRGSYPELYANPEREWIDYYQSYVKTYLERDVNKLIKAKNHLTFVRFMTAVAARTGQIINYANIASELDVSEVTVKEWISILEKSGPDTLKNGAMAGAMFETFVINEILKSYSNEGLEYDFDVYYYNGRDKKKKNENGEPVEVDGEIDLIIQENGILYPIEIKMSTMPKASMASEFDVLDGIPDKKRGMGAIICLLDRKLYLRENLVALPLEYL